MLGHCTKDNLNPSAAMPSVWYAPNNQECVPCLDIAQRTTETVRRNAKHVVRTQQSRVRPMLGHCTKDNLNPSAAMPNMWYAPNNQECVPCLDIAQRTI